MAQMNPTVGAIEYNTKKIIRFAEKARVVKADLVVFPELAISGYPPEDLLLKQAFIDDNLRALKDIAKTIKETAAVIGCIDREGDTLYNAAAVIYRGRIRGVYRKMYLPNYGVFDEERYFCRGDKPMNIVVNGVKVGLGICEDIWYEDGPATDEAGAGAELLVNINASPYHLGKDLLREEILSKRAIDNNAAVAYVNMVGGQDELVFDGRSMIIGSEGERVVEARAFKEELIVTDLDFEGSSKPVKKNKGVEEVTLTAKKVSVDRSLPIPKALLASLSNKSSLADDPLREVFGALVLGTKDYARKNGFKQVVIALSGGIDSALVLAVAVKALGADKVTTVFMPSKYTTKASVRDARDIAENFGVELKEIPIDDIFGDYIKLLKPAFKGTARDVTEENLQARSRGNIIMALSNKFGWLVLTTGNKSEMSVGYATLYGDMAGGFAVIKDVPKVLVYDLSEYVNKRGGKELMPPIPESILTKAPSAELSSGQKDSDSLPPYDVLDAILKSYIEDDMSIKEIVKQGYAHRLVTKIVAMVDRSEYKRRQAPPGIKITSKAFGRDRRMPITNRYESK